MRKVLAFLLLASSAALCWAQVGTNAAAVHTDIDWKASGSLPPGAEYHVIHEDKATHAVQSLVRFRSGYSLPPHSHTHDETIVVIKGKLIVEMNGTERTLKPGTYAFLPAGETHSLRTGGWGKCDFFLTLNGPFDIKGLPSPH